MSSLMVAGAVLASLAFGVLAAYGICQAMFRVFSFHATSVAKQRMQQSSSVSVAVEG